MTDLTEAQKIVLETAMKKYERNLKTFALDRAIEALKASNKQSSDVANELLEIATKICAWVEETPKEWPIPSQDEAEADLARMKAEGEIQ